ncbi:MAG: hypothetical protein AB7I30_15160 [Isosphaeraceae bacterium]
MAIVGRFQGHRRWAFGVAAGGVSALAGLVAWSSRPPRFQLDPLPVRNGYDDLIAAGRMIVETPPAEGDFDRATDDEIRDWVGAYPEALERARLGLGRATAVPLEPGVSLSPTYFENPGMLRRVARLLQAEATLADRSGDPSGAARAGLDLLRLGSAAGRGGLLIDRLTGIAIESLALNVLGGLTEKLEADDAQRLARAVEEIEHAREPIARVIDRDRQVSHLQSDLRMRLVLLARPGTLQKLRGPSETAAELADRRCQARIRGLALTLALRAYAREHPEAPIPPHVDDLIPAYLGAVPEDPFTRSPLKLRFDGGVATVQGVD